MAKAHITLLRATSYADTGDTLPIASKIVASSPPNAPVEASSNTWTQVAAGVAGGAVASLVVPTDGAGYHVLDIAALGGPISACVLASGVDPNSGSLANLFESVRVPAGGSVSLGGLQPGMRAWVRDAVVS